MIGLKKLMALSCVIGLLGFGVGVVQGAEFTLRYAGAKALGHHITRGQELHAKLIEQKTGGRVKVPLYPAGQLFSDKEILKAVQTGAVEMAEITSAQWTGVIPGLMLMDLPFFFTDRHHARRMVDGEAGDILRNDFEKVGVKHLYWMDYGSSDLIAKTPIRTLEDFKGKRIRGYGELVMESMRALGAAPTYLGAGEVYMALQRGTIDGAVTGVTSFWERKFYEVAKYVTYMEYVFTINEVVMNMKKWNELPPDIQKIIMDCSREAKEWGRTEAEKMDIECLELLKKKGVEVYVVPTKEKERWRKASKAAMEIFSKRTGEEGKLLLELAEKAR